MRHKKQPIVPIEYECRVCGEEFSTDDPCPHTEELRQENIAKFAEDNKPASKEELKVSMWSIAARLQYVDHIRR